MKHHSSLVLAASAHYICTRIPVIRSITGKINRNWKDFSKQKTQKKKSKRNTFWTICYVRTEKLL